MQGCTHPVDAPLNLVAKRSTNVSYVPMALTADRWAPGGRPITLVPDAFATGVVTATEAGAVAARGVTPAPARSTAKKRRSWCWPEAAPRHPGCG
jgi:hypothetical protein